MGWLEIIRVVLFCILYPVFFILSILYTIVYTVATPFISLASLLVRLVLLPWHIAAKFEVRELSIWTSLSNIYAAGTMVFPPRRSRGGDRCSTHTACHLSRSRSTIETRSSKTAERGSSHMA